MAVPILEARTNHSKQMLERIRTEIDSIEELKSEPNLSIYVTGSYGRLEASATSDLDPFFVYDDSEGTSSLSEISEILISARLIKICRTLELPEFSNEGQYLEVHSLNSMLKYLGGPEDDYRNYFTARLLLLLESQPLCNEEAYLKIIERIIEEYFRDYSTHERDFRPIFLVNDILTGIPQIKPTFLDIAPAGIPPNIIPHSKGVKCGLMRPDSLKFHAFIGQPLYCQA